MLITSISTDLEIITIPIKVIIHILIYLRFNFLSILFSDSFNKIIFVNIKIDIASIISTIEQKYGILPLSVFISATAHAEKTNKEIEPNNNSNKINPIVSTFFLYRFLLNTPILFIIVV